MTDPTRYRVLLSCPDRPGIVAEMSQHIARLGGNVTAAAQFTDTLTARFFMRYEVEVASASAPEAFPEALESELAPWLSTSGGTVTVRPAAHRSRVALLATKASHCVVELLQRWRTGELPCEVACIIANHPHIAEYADWFKVPFHHVPFPKEGKAHAFEEVERILLDSEVELAVLARFMQVIPDAMARRWEGRMINIHHSFLPSFMGARPYEQAHARGVKLVGATCHYVTPDLDEGPIIDQEVVRISHRDTPADLRRKGRICEREALARGIQLHLEDRVFIHGHRTVVFS